MKRILCLVCVLFISLSALCSCNKPKESDEELLSIFSALVEESKQVNTLLFGEGILTDERGEKIGAYREASADSLSSFGVESVADIEEKMQRVYSLSVCAWIKNTLLSSSKDTETGTVLTYARYYVGRVDKADKTQEDVFFVYTDYNATVGEVSYSNFEIVTKNKNLVTFSLTIEVTHEGNTKKFDDTITMFKEDHGWRLDAPTYATYE